MIKKILSIALIFSGLLTTKAQSFTATYDFASVTNTTGIVDPTPVPTATGLTFGSFSAVGTPSLNPTAGNRFAFSGWPAGATTTIDTYSTMTGSISTTQYYQVQLTPVAGYSVNIGTIAFTAQRPGTGMRSYCVRSSVDGYTANLPASVTSNTNLSVVGTNEFFWNFDAISTAQNGSTINGSSISTSSPITLRFYAWNSEAPAGSFGIDNVVITGSVTNVSACASPTITSSSSNSPICSNQPLVLQSAAITSTGSLTYSWAGNGSFSSTGVSSPTVTGATSGNYTLTVSNGCASTTAIVSATVNPTPLILVNSPSICSGGTATLTASGASTFTWSPLSVIGATATDSPTITSTYVVQGTTGNCTSAANATITVITTPTLSVNSTTVCAGGFATLTASGVSTYTWVSPSVNSSTISVNPSTQTTFTVNGNASGCPGTFNATGTVFVNALPTLVFSPVGVAICAGRTATLTVSGVATQTWLPGVSLTSTLIAVTPTVNTTYTVTGLGANNCANSNTILVTVNPLPTVIATSATICAGKTATLTASGTASTYTWNPTGTAGTTFTVAPTGIFNTYTVVGTSSVNCTKSTNVTVFVIPSTSLIVSASNSIICAGQSVSLTAVGATSYTWTNGVINGAGFTPTITATYTVTGSIGTCTNSAVRTITVNTCTGIEDVTNMIVSSIYPNPNNGNFTIQSSIFPSELVIFDLTGKKVLQKTLTDLNTTINVSDFDNGIYYLRILNQGLFSNHKIVISK